MKVTEYAITKRTVSYFLTLTIIGGGLIAYQRLGRLEFPTFTIKTAVVVTPYPGASAEAVEQEITDLLEQAVQQLAQIKEVRSISQTGLSIIYVDIQNKYFNDKIPQIWDELRRKVSDVQDRLPPGAGRSHVNDDFGDVYGVFFAVTGVGYSYEEIKDYVDYLKRELLLVKDVASVNIWGDQQEVIYLTQSRARMSELGVSMQNVLNTLNLQNRVKEAGQVKVDHDYIRIAPTGEFTDVADLGDLLVRSDDEGNLFYLKDLVDIHRGYEDPPRWLLRYNGRLALGLGISTVDGGNVVEMGKAVSKRIEALKAERPVGMELGIIAYQSDLVSASVKSFIINLVEAVAIVIFVLCLTMGFASGILMGVILLLTILGTFIVMRMMSIDLHLISLGALILALGMLVDNAIVVTEGILVRVQQGIPRKKAAVETVSQTAWPLLGATLVAVLAFAAIGTSEDFTGEFLMSLFLVMAISLGLSWILAITLTPLFCVQFLPKNKSGKKVDPYRGMTFQFYRHHLNLCLKHRALSLLGLFVLLVSAIIGFTYVENSFFPNDNRNQFLIDYWRPQGTHIIETASDMEKLENYLGGLEEVSATAIFVGQGALRFLLTYEPEMPNTSYGQLLVTVKDYRKIDSLIPQVRAYIQSHCPDAQTVVKKFVRGTGKGSKVEIRFRGPDIAVLRQLSEQAQAIMASDPLATEIKDDWRQSVMVLRPQVVEAKARRLGITRDRITDTMAINFSGKAIGLYREENKMIPIILKAPQDERDTVDQVNDIVVISPASGKSVPLRQLVSNVETSWEAPIIRRRNRERTITAMCNPLHGNASVLFNRIRSEIESITLSSGYEMAWGGEYEGSTDAQRALFQMVPIFFLAMVVTVVILFNAFRQTVIIFLCLPLATIGVAGGLLLTGVPFGFMCLLGFLGLSGMLIKNAVVLIDQIDLEIREGKDPYEAILDSSVSRLRPVTMAALTTVLGMLPLLTDVFFAGMSVTIMGGLTFGTVLTLIVVPVLYATFYRIPYPGQSKMAIYKALSAEMTTS
jgi:multidrug efflux pump subunit AcrB